MSFYTSVHRYGNNILFRGYNANGVRIHKKVKFKPSFFLPTNDSNTEWKGLDGRPVIEHTLQSMSEAKEFIKKYEDVHNFKVYGNNNYVVQFLDKAYPDDVPYKANHICVGDIDIEVASDDGFPHPDACEKEVISITYKDNKSSIYHVWGMGDYDYTKTELDLKGCMIQYRKCDTEDELLQKFVKFWEESPPDVITGWHIRFFDIPYLFRRISKICGVKTAKALSPWGVCQEREIFVKGETQIAYDIYGVAQMDYLELFKKFGVYTYGPQETYKLDHIAHVVLGEKKLSYDEYGSLHRLYKENYQKFIDYNIRDVMLVDALDTETGLMELALNMAYKGGVNYHDVLGTTAIWDSIIYRYLSKLKIAVPPSERHEKMPYPGGYVKEPRIGMTEWICSFDLNSLYPNLIVQYNMSPETYVRDEKDVNSVDYYLSGNPISKDIRDKKYAVAANGACFRKDKTGFLPKIIIDLYDERKATKSKMLKVQQENEITPSDELNKEANQLSTSQMAIKLLLNSLYGALGNVYFRYYELEMAIAITLSGQLAIRWAEKAMNSEMNNQLQDSKDHVIAIDTDSIYVDMGNLPRKPTPEEHVKYLDDMCENTFVPVLSDAYSDMFTHMNGYSNRMKMAREVIADRGVWTAKKHYILNVYNNEGVQYAEPKIKIMGVSAVKSSGLDENAVFIL